MNVDSKDNDMSPEGPEVPPGPEEPLAAPSKPAAPKVEKKRPKVSLIAAIVVNVVTVITIAIVLLAILLPGYRRSFTIARATKGAEEVLIVVRTSEGAMRDNNTDFIDAQDSLKNALQELVRSGGENVYAYVRDNYPDQGWVEANLPDGMKEWLRELYPRQQEEEEDLGEDEEDQQQDESPVEDGEREEGGRP